MNKYNNGKIYKIISNQTDNIYIGSTTKELKQRYNQHRAYYKKYVAGKNVQIKSVEILKLGEPGCEIILIENYPCSSKQALLEREQFYLDKFQAICVNKNKAFRTPDQKYIDKVYSVSMHAHGFAFCRQCWLTGHFTPLLVWHKDCSTLRKIRDERKMKNKWEKIPERLLIQIRKHTYRRKICEKLILLPQTLLDEIKQRYQREKYKEDTRQHIRI